MITYILTSIRFGFISSLCFTGVTILLSLTVFLNMVAETMVSALILIQGVDSCEFRNEALEPRKTYVSGSEEQNMLELRSKTF